MAVTHGVTHWDPESCYGCRLKTVNLAPSALPSRGTGEAIEVKEREARWERDIDAYTTLRRQGYQPRSVDGSHRMATVATHPAEIQMGTRLHTQQGKELAEQTGIGVD